MQLASRQAKAEFVRFWCMRAAEGRQHSRAQSKVTLWVALQALFGLLVYALVPHQQADVIVLAHPDRGAANLVAVPYVGKLSQALARRHRLLLLQMQPLGAARNVSAYPWLGMRILERLVAKLHPGLNAEDRLLAKQLADDYAIPFASVSARIRRLNFELRQWYRLLSYHRPKMVILVDGYSANAALIWMARQMGIPTMEVQHGACGPSHVGYRMIGQSPEYLTPDYFLAWNTFWRDRMADVRGYRSKFKICSMIAQTLEDQSDNLLAQHEMLLIHQPSLSQVLFDLLARLPDRTGLSPISVKYHPGIQPEWEKRIDALCARKGITVLRDQPIEDVIGDYELVVGWFSTVLHQAADAGYTVKMLSQRGYEVQQKPLLQRGVPSMTESEFLQLGKL